MFNSQLHDEKSFYRAFLRDLDTCRKEVIIESPFITTDRMKTFKNTFEGLINRGVKTYVITRDPGEHSNGFEVQSEKEIQYFEALGVQVFLCKENHHRKLAILDRKVLWEGSLNILSQMHSREIMRRINDEEVTLDMFHFLKYSKVL